MMLTMIAISLMCFTSIVRAATLSLVWNPNQESDLMGYKIYYSLQSNDRYSSVDVGKVTEYTLEDLNANETYYICLTAYDQNGNESYYSDEIALLVQDNDKPQVVNVTCHTVDMIKVVFDETISISTSEITANYQIDNGIVVTRAERQNDHRTIHLYTNMHANGTYNLTVTGVRDSALVPNQMDSRVIEYTWNGNDDIAPTVVSVKLIMEDMVEILFSEAMDPGSVRNVFNYLIDPEVTRSDISLDPTFTKVRITTGIHDLSQEYTMTIRNVSDGFNQITTVQIPYSWESSDVTAPTLIAAQAVDASTVDVQFSEELNKETAENSSNYSINNDVSVNNAVLNQDNVTVRLTTSAHTGGQFTVQVSGVGDDATPTNTITSAHLDYDYEAPDNTRPTVESVTVEASNLIKAAFSEPVTEASAQNVSNYGFVPSVTVENITLDASGLYVLLQVVPLESASYRLTLNNIQDRASSNNTIAANTYSDFSYSSPDVTAPEILTVNTHGANLVEVIFSESVERTSAETITNYAFSSSVTISNAALVGDNLDRVYLTVSNLTAGVSYILSVNQITDRASSANVIISGTEAACEYTIEDYAAPKMLDVDLIGTAYLKITFDEPLEQVHAENINNYSISSNIQIINATLDASYHSVFLQTADHQPGETYQVSAMNLEDRANPANVMGQGNSLTYECLSIDNTRPALKRAESHGARTVEILFTEPLDPASALNAANYQIDNGITINSVSLSDAQTAVFLETSTHMRGEYIITISGVTDASNAHNMIISSSQVAYTYTPKDGIAPLFIEANFLNPNTVELLFSEPLHRNSAETESNYTINKSISIDKAELNYDGNKVILSTSKHLPGNYKITVSNVKDASAAGNTIDGNVEKTYTYETVDNVPPTIFSVVLNEGNRLSVTFNEALDTLSACESTNYKINNGIQVQSAILTASQNMVILITSEHVAGDYQLTVNGVCDGSASKNPIAAYEQRSFSWNPPDKVKPRLDNVELLNNTTITLTFSEALNQADVENIANYQISPAVMINEAALLAGLNKVRLETSAHEPGDYTITVTNIKDLAFNPNTIGSANQKNYSYIPPDTEAPTLVSAQLGSSPSILKLYFNESLSREAAQNEANYVISAGVEVIEANLTGNNDDVVFLETSTHQISIDYTITVSNLSDRAPVANQMSTPATFNYRFTPPDKEGPKMLAAKLLSGNQLEISFDEQLDKASAEDRSNYKIESGIEIQNITLDPQSRMRVKLETTAHMPGLPYTVYAVNIRDRAPSPNPMAAGQSIPYSYNNVSGSSVDNIAPSIARIDLISNTSIDVIFSEIVDKQTSENKNNYKIEGLTIKSAILDTHAVRVHLTTSLHTDGVDYSLNINNIKDAASNTMSTKEIVYFVQSGIGLSGLNQAGYDMCSFAAGNTCYSDRNYTMTQVPTVLTGSIQIKTANDDKTNSDENFLSFELSGEASIYIAYDQHIQELPSWMNDWKLTGEQIISSRSGVYLVYSKEYHAGRVTLGGNASSVDDNMYLAFVKPLLGSRSIVGSMSKAMYCVDRLSVGDALYLDREYTLATLPEALEDLLWIKTMNDDKTNQSENFLEFDLNNKATLYLAYDAAIENLPTWMDDFDRTILKIVDSRGVAFDVYARDYKAGHIVLGGNQGASDDNMYMILLEPEAVDTNDAGNSTPGDFNIFQNYPNPFNPKTTIRFMVENSGHVKLAVYNVMGQLVKVLVDGEVAEEMLQVVEWDGTDRNGVEVASGMYFYRLEQGQFAKCNRMILMR